MRHRTRGPWSGSASGGPARAAGRVLRFREPWSHSQGWVGRRRAAKQLWRRRRLGSRRICGKPLPLQWPSTDKPCLGTAVGTRAMVVMQVEVVTRRAKERHAATPGFHTNTPPANRCSHSIEEIFNFFMMRARVVLDMCTLRAQAAALPFACSRARPMYMRSNSRCASW